MSFGLALPAMFSRRSRADGNFNLAALPVPATALILLGAALLGAALPVIGLAGGIFLVSFLLLPVMLMLPSERLVALAVVLAVFSRTLVALGAPSLINFAHYGLVLVAMLKILETRSPRPTRGLEIALLAFLGSVILSAVANQWYVWRPVLVWLSFAEPFIFLGLVVCLSVEAKARLQKLVIALALLQIPFVLAQFAMHGLGDQVQGTLIGEGAGHHILGAIGVIGGLLLFLRNPRGGLSPLRLVPSALLLFLAVFSDAKQVYAAFAAGLLALGLLDFRRTAPMLLAPAAVAISLIFLGTRLDHSFAWFADKAIIGDLADQKVQTSTKVIDDIGWAHAAYGVGPGNGISRIALSTVPGYSNIPGFLLGSGTATIALREFRSYDSVLVSSAASPFSSWLGLYSDLGVFGVMSYVAMVAWVWLRLGQSPSNQRTLGRYLLASAMVLGMIFSWLEEPVFMIYLGVVIGTCMTSRQDAAAALKPS